MDFLNQHLSEIFSFLGGILAGGIGGVSITKYINKADHSKKTIQKGINAGGDVAGGNINKSNK
ncbi:hypothetical protein [Acinetobacter sp. NIPH 2699]|uniref:hypothetical protein n=1 Tax=Acinetobacter sp. NIPH 2699 TaxID=2923433 RepID=UPI001F4A262F|nr:hypothetical protein [Acinetobacter sp. NIPH 2699]MCH7337108.1 hypothetical protein [Acinetobacter sp. NIPH 2699]